MERNYAPADTRLRADVARERKMPQVLMEARKNLTNPPRIFTEIALEQIDGLVAFFSPDMHKRWWLWPSGRICGSDLKDP